MNEPLLPLDARRTSDELAEAAPDIALLPIGATEQHSHHLPCCTDTMVADYVCDRIAERLSIWRLPTLPVSISHMHRGSAGSVWVTNDTLARLVKDIVLSVRYQGIRKVVIANFHGGNFIVRPVVQDLNRDYEDMTVILLEPQVDTSDIFEHPSPMPHAEEAETSSIRAGPHGAGERRDPAVHAKPPALCPHQKAGQARLLGNPHGSNGRQGPPGATAPHRRFGEVYSGDVRRGRAD